MSLYEKLANEIAQSIRDGVLRVGDKLPSVRDACASRGVSPSTVFQAYYLLEARGLIRARPPLRLLRQHAQRQPAARA